MPENQNGSFRPKRINFAQISNTALQDKSLSLKAKGLYALIQSLITIPGIDLRLWKLRSLCKEGNKAWDSAWKELKEAGYLKQYRIPKGEKGAFVYEYDLLFEPDLSTPATINLSKDRKKIKAADHIPQNGGSGKTAEKACEESEPDHIPQNGGGGQNLKPDHTSHFAPSAKSTVCLKQPVENGGGNSNTLFSNTPSSNTKSVSLLEEDIDRQTDEIRKALMNQIDFDWIAETHPEDSAAAESLLNCMVEMLSAPFTRIGSTTQSRYALRKQLEKVDEEDIVGFIAHMRDRSIKPKDIRNIGAYWKSSFVNYLSEETLAAATI